MLAKDLMTSSNLIVIDENENIRNAIDLLLKNRVSGVPVVDSSFKLKGVLSELDLMVAGGLMNFDMKVIFNKTPFTIKEDTPLKEIINIFVHHRFKRLFVVDPNGKLLGIVSRRDIIKYYHGEDQKLRGGKVA